MSKVSPPEQSAPVVYADNITAIAIGPFVSKVVFGLEGSPGQNPSPSMQLTLPTNVLQAMAVHIVNAMRSSEVKEQVTKGHKEFQETLAAVA